MKRISTPPRQCDLPRPERWARRGALHDAKQQRVCRQNIHRPTRSVQKRNLPAGEWDSSSACCLRKASQAFTLAWQTAIRLAWRSSFPTPAWPQSVNERTAGASAQANERFQVARSTSSKIPTDGQASSGVRASSRLRRRCKRTIGSASKMSWRQHLRGRSEAGVWLAGRQTM